MDAMLQGVRVLDLSRVLAGPWATQLLADLGAEVIKVERPGRGDDTRRWGPPFLSDRNGEPTGESAYYLSANRGKKSVTIDLAKPRGQALVRDLARASDVVVENFKPGTLARYGLDFGSVKRVRPDVVYCSITGFGQGGPWRDRAAYDVLIQGMGGLMSITGEPEGRPGGGPMKVGVAITDVFTGLYAAVAILAALRRRDQTGEGVHLDLALLDVSMATLANQALNFLVSGMAPGRLGTAHPNIVPYQAFRTKDGHMILAIGNDAQFARFCEAVGHPELAVDDRFATNASRVQHRDELVSMIQTLFEGHNTRAWLARLEEYDVSCGPICALDEVFTSQHAEARDMVAELDHPLADSLRVVSSPIKTDGATATSDRPPPLLGQHTDEILGNLLEMDADTIEVLRKEAVL